MKLDRILEKIATKALRPCTSVICMDPGTWDSSFLQKGKEYLTSEIESGASNKIRIIDRSGENYSYYSRMFRKAS